MDTQWERYEVFEKERADLPHRNTGTVHAPDAEMALQNARDVFVRRPNCLSLWVVPARAVYSRTAEQLARGEEAGVETGASAEPERYLVFQKETQSARETFVAFVGEVQARSPREAMTRAQAAFSRPQVYVWWVVPERAVVKSEETDRESMFEPAHSKEYRQHRFYPVEPIMRQLKSAGEMEGTAP